MSRVLLFSLIVILMSCRGTDEKHTTRENTLFQKMLPEQTGIDFQNTLTLGKDFDVFRYRNFYNGGGVAIGDINNDGLADVYLTSNMGDNKLFLNKGNWKFEDITKKAGV
ncbi:MAG TPA: VCBS repeat-containing protein, partial [Cyclobacteriaceae bacterium]